MLLRFANCLPSHCLAALPFNPLSRKLKACQFSTLIATLIRSQSQISASGGLYWMRYNSPLLFISFFSLIIFFFFFAKTRLGKGDKTIKKISLTQFAIRKEASMTKLSISDEMETNV